MQRRSLWSIIGITAAFWVSSTPVVSLWIPASAGMTERMTVLRALREARLRNGGYTDALGQVRDLAPTGRGERYPPTTTPGFLAAQE